jgi:hypothetical protein
VLKNDIPIIDNKQIMKKYTYNLFPKPFVVAGYALICLAFVLVAYNIISGKGVNYSNDFVSYIALIFIGLVLISFKSEIIIADKSDVVIKESSMLGMTLSSEKVKIPSNCDKIIIKQKNKVGTGYYRYVLPVHYNFKSFDMFFHSESGVVRLINTDCSRAIKIANFFKSNKNLDYTLELLQDLKPHK